MSGLFWWALALEVKLWSALIKEERAVENTTRSSLQT